MELPQPTHKNYTTLIGNIDNEEIMPPSQFQKAFLYEQHACVLGDFAKRNCLHLFRYLPAKLVS